MAKGIRLDQALVQRGLFASRHQAQAAIMAGEVRIDGQVATKASDSVQEQHELSVAARSRYVGRGGIKLEGAIAHFGIACQGKTALDIGASTGGFTDCLLLHGARKVFAVDVGHGQLAWKIRDDARVVTLEKINARRLSRDEIPDPIEICVIDVSFISLTLILPSAFELLTSDGVILALIKPQFELAREDVSRGGIVRSSELHEKAQQKIVAFAQTIGAQVQGLVASSITGADGNQEFFICLRKPSA
ncbi:MAG: TlyA family RNA methyltransferase [Chthoniobacterales bacterium]|nr:TlyA family RNA methyltransferase [Chthoniobacterales bacterium]